MFSPIFKKNLLVAGLAAFFMSSPVFSMVAVPQPRENGSMPSFSMPNTPEMPGPVNQVMGYEKLFGTLASFAELMQLWTEWSVSKELRPLREKQNDLMTEIVDHQEHLKNAVEGSVAQRGMLLALEGLQAEHDEVKPVADEVEEKGRRSVGRWMRMAQILYALDSGLQPFDKNQKYDAYRRGSSALGHLLTMSAKEHANIGEHLWGRLYLVIWRLFIHLSRKTMRRFGNEKRFQTYLDWTDALRSLAATGGTSRNKTRIAALLAHLVSAGLSSKNFVDFWSKKPKRKGPEGWGGRARAAFVGNQVDGDKARNNMCKLFGVEKNGLNYEKLRKAYHKFALRNHPDKDPSPEAAARFKIGSMVWAIFDEGEDSAAKEAAFASRFADLQHSINRAEDDDLQAAVDSLGGTSAPTPAGPAPSDDAGATPASEHETPLTGWRAFADVFFG